MKAWRAGLFWALIVVAIAVPCAVSASDSSDVVLQNIRRVFRLQGAPPYEAYTISREQELMNGMPDLMWTYAYRVWFRSSDHAALGRRVFHGRLGSLVFMRPAFNEPRDPGPPTADLFEKAPAHPDFDIQVNDREFDPLPVIGAVNAIGEVEYRVSQILTQGPLLHLSLTPRRDAERNRLRELWVDAKTLELKRVVATDRLYILGGPVYPLIDTITMGEHDGRPVVTDIHTHTNFDNEPGGAAFDCDYHFSDIVFLNVLPPWYFEPAAYGAHVAEAPP